MPMGKYDEVKELLFSEKQIIVDYVNRTVCDR